jgi:hypothetical protein
MVSVDGAPFVTLLESTTDTNTTIAGDVGVTYAFTTVARDFVGNVEATPLSPDAITTVSATAGRKRLAGNRLLVKDSDVNPDKRKIVLFSKDPGIIVGSQNPMAAGAIFRLGNAGSGEEATFQLAGPNWKGLGEIRGTKWNDLNADGGPIGHVERQIELRRVAFDARINAGGSITFGQSWGHWGRCRVSGVRGGRWFLEGCA